jgi:alpha-glucuronidase
MKRKYLSIITLLLFAIQVSAEDGSRLWLRNDTSNHANVICNNKSQTTAIAVDELQKAWKGIPITLLIKKNDSLGEEGFCISSNNKEIILSAKSPIGLLYGAFDLLRLQATDKNINNINIREIPYYSLRILDHWDNLDGSIERGYAGKSLWEWKKLPNNISNRYKEYARANASIGINATVLNNVNASPKMLSVKYLKRIKVLADIFRPYGIRVFLSVNFASSKVIGHTKTADPLNPNVIAWWNEKTKEIYSLIPDFGGFLVKANSEGQPGPGDYGRSHADGANMLADAVKPYGGIVMWRAFVYGNHDGDRVKQAVEEFKPLDGQFRDNVIIQIKNGPLDFQPREPYNPLFDNLHKTKMMAEFQITQEYLGQSTHLVFLSPMWKEFFDFVSPSSLKAVAGVANIGNNTNWCGHHFAQANWYTFGRLAWNPSLTSEQIADEWIRQTFSNNEALIKPVKDIMMNSREATVNYMMPLGLHHIFKANHHYGPEPWGNQMNFPEMWKPVYYHKADHVAVGYDRSSTGTNAINQYRHPYDSIYNNIKTCPEKYLLWFHHVPWNYTLKDGRTLWNEMCYKYDNGVKEVYRFLSLWNSVEPYVDVERFTAVRNKLQQQLENAICWKESCLLYFQTFSGMPIPVDIKQPKHSLKELMNEKKMDE